MTDKKKMPGFLLLKMSWSRLVLAFAFKITVVVVLFLQEGTSSLETSSQYQVYDLWALGGGNVSKSVLYRSNKDLQSQALLSGIQGFQQAMGCHLDLRFSRTDSLVSSESTTFMCELDETGKFDAPRKSHHSLLNVRITNPMYAIEIKRDFSQAYRAQGFFLDMETAFVSAVSIAFHGTNGRDEDLKLRYTKTKEDCLIYFSELQKNEECLNLDTTGGLLNFNIGKATLVTAITIRIFPTQSSYDWKQKTHGFGKRYLMLRHIVVQGSCDCSDHARGCVTKGRVLTCNCIKGHCNDRCTGRWLGYGTQKKICSDGSGSGSRRKRKACSCNPVGTLYGLCHPLESLGNKCLCKRNFIGQFCDVCANGYWGYPKCQECKCNVLGSKSSTCNTKDGNCECSTLPNSAHAYRGKTCNQCPSGYFGFPTCKACECSILETSRGRCDQATGKCLCREGYTGTLCNNCAPGYYGYPNCTACNCSKTGSLSASCNSEGVCKCKRKFTGDRCTNCAEGFKSYPVCTACECNKEGSVNTTCNPRTGQCPCKEDFADLLCDQCKSPGAAFPQCKQKCYCDLRGAVPGRPQDMCGSSSKFCFCKEFVSGVKCNRCKKLYYNLTKSNPSGCDYCSCSQIGTFGGLRTCSQSTGECLCKSAVTGRQCNMCKPGYFGLSASKLLGCQACHCNPGGSVGPSCDSYGVCNCKTGVTGNKCERLASDLLYVPSIFNLKFEVEEGRGLHGSPISFRYSYAEFPGFSSRGYIAMGVSQSVIALSLTVPKSASYRVALSYILRKEKTASCVVRLRNKKDTKTFYYGIVILKSSLNKISKRQHALVSDANDWFLTSKGDWELTISSTADGLLVDYVALLPDEYFHGRTLDKAPLQPCKVGQKQTFACETYRYLPLKKNNTVTFEAEEGYTGGNIKGVEAKRPEVFLDPDVLRELNSNGMAVFNNIQKVLNFDIKTQKDGEHYLVVSFFNPDSSAYLVRVFLDQVQGFAELSSCTLKFICRVVVLETNGAPMPFRFSSSKAKTVIFIANVAGTLAVDSVTAIPVEDWADDFLRPSVYCISVNGVCTRPAKYPTPNIKVPLFPDRSNPADPLTGSVHATEKMTVIYGGKVPHTGRYWFIFQYYQPLYPAFDVKTQINTGNITESSLPIRFCPGTSGCRQHQRLETKSRVISVTMEVPEGRNFWMDEIFLVPDEEFLPEILVTRTDQRSELYKSKCFDEQLLPLQRPVSTFCRKAIFTLSLSFNKGPKQCDCNPLGSVSDRCKEFDGACKCRPNVVGRKCDRCRTGYFQFPNCRPCRCFVPGSLSPDCSSFGQCKCKPQFGGWRCTRCNAMGYYGFPECKPCLCDKEGSLSTFCRGSSGQCQCRVNFDGRTCSKCRVGYRNYPKCKRCKCDPVGIVVTRENPTGCPNTEEGDCLCKKNVEGEFCDRCKRNFYNLQPFNIHGCDACSCNAAGTVNGITACGQLDGKCHCKLFVRGRTCDECMDGFFKLESNNVFGCKACDCDPGGSLDKTCNKRTGQCKCRPNVHGRRCNRIISNEFYIPSLHHIISKPMDGDNNNMFDPNGRQSKVKKIPRLLQLKVPRTAVFFLLLQVNFSKLSKASLSLSIRDSVTKDAVLKTDVTLKRPTNHSSHDAFSITLRDDGSIVTLRLMERTYIAELSYNDTMLGVEALILIPEDYQIAKVLKKEINKPCTVDQTEEECLRYSYLSLPRRHVYTLEAEAVRQSNLPALGPKDLNGLNFNGAVTLLPGQSLSFTVSGASNCSYVTVLQYHNIQMKNATFKITAVVGNKVMVGSGTFVHCPYSFGCRQAALDEIGTVKMLEVADGVQSWSVIVEVMDGNVTLDLLGLVPSEKWSMDFIKPSLYCLSRRGVCRQSSVALPENTYILEAENGTTVKPATHLPAGFLHHDAKLIHITEQKTTLSWNINVPRGRYVILFKYFQPVGESFTAKIVVSTPRRAFAGKFLFRHCPKVTGCHGVLQDLTWQDQVFAIYINVNYLVVSIDNPKESKLWLDYVTLLPFYEFSENVLREQPLTQAEEFRKTCLGKNWRLLEPLSKLCEHLLFQITTAYNNGPLQCNCHPQGSTVPTCNPVAGQCRCKAGIRGRRCDRCLSGARGFPFCRQPV